jgi:hypothetical protein
VVAASRSVIHLCVTAGVGFVDVHEGGGCRYIVESDRALLESEALM